MLMSTATLLEMASLGTQFYQLTVEQYHEMISKGILPEGAPFELIDGYIVQKDRSAAGEDPMTQGDRHMWVVMKLLKLNRQLEKRGCHLRPQMAITLPPYHEPEPDGVVVLGTDDDYRKRKPTAKDTLCVIEVSDASLRYDQTEKLRMYAESGIECYVIVNLRDRLIEVYTDPLKRKGRYGQNRSLRSGESLEIPTGRSAALSVPVKRLLP
jgi:Uma2 family endonuclease